QSPTRAHVRRIPRNRKNRPQAALSDWKARAGRSGSPLPVASVAEQQPALMDERAHRSDVTAAVHDGKFGLRQLVDDVELAPVAEVGGGVQDLGEVDCDEDGSVAVAFVVRVAGQADDSVVCYADAAALVEPAQAARLI